MKILKANNQRGRVLNSSIQQAYKFSVDSILCNILERAVMKNEICIGREKEKNEG